MPGVRLADRDPGARMAWLEALTQIEQVGRAETVDAARLRGRVALDEHDGRLLAALDRVGLAPIELLAMASPDDLTQRALAGRLARLHREGLIVRHHPRSPGGAALPAALLDHRRRYAHRADSAPACDLHPATLAVGRGGGGHRGRAPSAGAGVDARTAARRGGHRHGQLADPPL